jgi:hypothetical protein
MADSAMQEHLRPELARIKSEMDELAPKTIPLPDKAKRLFEERDGLVEQLKHIETVKAESGERQKAEAVRSLFTKIIVPFDKVDHEQPNNVRWRVRKEDVVFDSKPVGHYGFAKSGSRRCRMACQ